MQLGIILVVFPALALLRRRAPLAGLSATGAIAAGVCAMGLVWFAERAFANSDSSHPEARLDESSAPSIRIVSTEGNVREVF